MAIARLLGGSLILGKYQTLKLLGQGGMGASFLGRCRTTGARVVIKQMHRELANHPVARALFDRELDVMRRFRHPFAVEMIDGGWHGDVPCLVLEYVDGITLEEYVARHGRIEPRRLGRWLGQLCLVLHAAHAAGILHRDLTLANLMLVDRDTAHEHIKVLDFGLAQRHGGVYVPLEKVVGAAASIGGGTPDYLCPEQIAGGPVDARSDIYSLGVVLYKLLTGHLPFEHADSVAGILQAQQHETPPRFACHGISDLPLPLEAVVRLCLEKDPNERPQTARELAELYAEALGEEIVPPQSFAESTMSP
ncbi:MAG: serine/threonine protein kinase, partial [Gemmataceae bacterium]|nr:serine/threonine protein kinase [Gemmataceae bacterium]